MSNLNLTVWYKDIRKVALTTCETHKTDKTEIENLKCKAASECHLY